MAVSVKRVTAIQSQPSAQFAGMYCILRIHVQAAKARQKCLYEMRRIKETRHYSETKAIQLPYCCFKGCETTQTALY